MQLLREYIRKEMPLIQRNNIRMRFLGRIEELPVGVQKDVRDATERTASNTGMYLCIALNYGGRAEIVDALNATVELIGNETWLSGGKSIALSTAYQDGLAQVFGPKPTGDYFMEGGFTGSVAINDVNTKLKAGNDIAFFPFPSIDAQYQNPVVGGGDFAVAFDDSAVTKQFMAYLASPDGANAWAAQGVISPNKNLDTSAFGDPLVKAEAGQLTGAGIFKFDGTDLMPGSLGDDWNTVVQSVFQNPSSISDQLANFQQEAATEFAH
jgi:alpha-glucoside transport system substrate-binding protein